MRKYIEQRVTGRKQQKARRTKTITNPNTNCLSGMKCPNAKCPKPYGPFAIVGHRDDYFCGDCGELGGGLSNRTANDKGKPYKFVDADAYAAKKWKPRAL
jgi:hypothetical protein